MVADHPRPRSAERGVGRRRDARHRGRRSGRRDPRRALRGRASLGGGERPARRRTRRGARRDAARVPGRGRGALAARAVPGARRPDPRGPVPLPDARHDRRHSHPARRRHPCRGRHLRVRHDDGHRPGHLGGGPRRRGLRRDCGRPGAGGGAGGVRTVSAARPPRHAGRLRRLLLPQQRRRRGPGAAPRRARAGRRHRHRRAPWQRHRRDLLRPRGRSLRVGPRRSGHRLVPAHRGVRRRDRHRRRRRLHPQPADAGGDCGRPVAGGDRGAWPAGQSPRGARPWWSRSESTPPSTIPRAR